MALSRLSQDVIEYRTIPSATIDTKIQSSLMAYYDDLTPESQYIKDIRGIMEQAKAYLEHYLAEHKNHIASEKPAIVLDIDDTSVSNYFSILKDNFRNTDDLVELRYRAAKQVVIDPVLRFSQKAVDQGVSLFFITARKPQDKEIKENIYSYTLQTLEQTGYKNWTELFIPEEKDMELSSAQFKINRRKNITDKGYKIIVNIGDQLSDLEGGYSERTYKLPNYLYPKLGLPLEDTKTVVDDFSSLASLSMFANNPKSNEMSLSNDKGDPVNLAQRRG